MEYPDDATIRRSFSSRIIPTGRIGLAVSSDGVHWERSAGPSGRGAVFEAHRDPERFDSTHVGVNCVHRIDGLYWMWYFGGDRSRFRVSDFDIKGLQLRPGCAVSREGLRWQRLEGPSRGVLLDLGPPGAFDMATCGQPQVAGRRWFGFRTTDGEWTTAASTRCG